MRRHRCVWLWMVVASAPGAVRAEQPTDYDLPPVPPATAADDPSVREPEVRTVPPVRGMREEPTPSTPPRAARPTLEQAPSAAPPAPGEAGAFPPAPPPGAPSSLPPSVIRRPAEVPPPAPVDAAVSGKPQPSAPPQPPPPPPRNTYSTAQLQAKPFHAALLLGLGATFDDTLGSVNPLGFGVGLRGDYQVHPRVVVGARFMFFTGGSSDLATGRIGMQSWLVAVEGAYPIQFDDILLRPGLALGVMARAINGRPALTSDAGTGYVSGSRDDVQTGLYFSPGLNVIFPLAMIHRDLALFFWGGDARLDLVVGSGVSANVQLLAQGGIHF